MALEVKLLQTIHFEVGADAKVLESKLLAIEDIRVETIEKFDGNSELYNINPIVYAKENGLIQQKKSSQMSITEFL